MANAKIMIVEDSPTILRNIRDLLQNAGYKTVTAIDGEEALGKAVKESPSLIVLDVILPKKNGFQVCRQLKTSPATQNIKIILLTSKSQDSDRFWGLKQGADEYLTKPFAENVLLANVTRLLSEEPTSNQETRITG